MSEESSRRLVDKSARMVRRKTEAVSFPEDAPDTHQHMLHMLRALSGNSHVKSNPSTRASLNMASRHLLSSALAHLHGDRESAHSSLLVAVGHMNTALIHLSKDDHSFSHAHQYRTMAGALVKGYTDHYLSGDE